MNTFSQKLEYIDRNFDVVREIQRLEKDTFTFRDVEIPLEAGRPRTVLQYLESIDCLSRVDESVPAEYRTASLNLERLHEVFDRHLSGSPKR